MDEELSFREVLDALRSHIAIVREDGTIEHVNRAWQRFWDSNSNGCSPGGSGARAGSSGSGASGASGGVGANYFGVCERAEGDCLQHSALILQGMRDVLEGKLSFYEMEYPCHAPDEKRWFVARISALESAGGGRKLVVAHDNSTEPRRIVAQEVEAKADAARDRSVARELGSMRSMSSSASPVTSGLLGIRPLKDAAPYAFDLLVARYGACLKNTIESQMMEGNDEPARTLRQMAEELEALRAGPRDVTDLHLASLDKLSRSSTQVRARAYAEEGRLVVLQLMGFLAQQYRGYAFSYTGGKRG